MKIIPVILSGGSGTRLWPASRASRPKQFLSFSGDHTLFQETVLRCRGSVFDPRPIVVGSQDHRFLLAENLLSIGVEADIVLEPVARNSCAAIAAGAFHALSRDRDAIILALAADHFIADRDAFSHCIENAVADAQGGYLVTFGVKPDRPATGYGYVAPGEALGSAKMVDAFIEKPDLATAEQFVRQGYLWNSGNFLFRADTFLNELGKQAPTILGAVEKAYAAAQTDLDFLRLDLAAFSDSPSISVDHAVMEKTDRAAVLPVEYVWSDIGSWDAVASLLANDKKGNTVVGRGFVLDGSNNLVHSTGHLTTLVGMNDCIAVSTRDCMLVVHKDRSEEVKALVEMLKADGLSEVNEALQIFRPWGNYEQLDSGEMYQVKRIVVKPGGVLSLQKHQHRAEHWIVVSGKAEATIGDEVQTLKANESAFVPIGVVHRLANRSSEPLILIEVQTGEYLGEDDIIRLDDKYNRSRKPESVME